VRESGGFRSDQSAVWDEVSTSLHELGVNSATSDFREGREKVAHKLEKFVEAIRPAENQIGSIFLSAQGHSWSGDTWDTSFVFSGLRQSNQKFRIRGS